MSSKEPWNRFPDVAAAAVAAPGGTGRVKGLDRQAQALHELARGTSRPYLLLYRAAGPPDEGWVQSARQALEESSLAACVGAGTGQGGIVPSLLPEANPLLLRRGACLEGGGLSADHRGVGDGPDLAWRLWAMGYTVLSLPVDRRPEPPSSVYRVYSNWVWTLARVCEAETLDWALSRALLAMLALAGKKASATDVVEPPLAAPPAQRSYIQEKNTVGPRETDLAAPFHRVSRGVGEALTAFHDMVMALLPQAFARRPAVQSLRRRSDSEIAAAAGEEPVQAVERCYLGLACQALGLEERDGDAVRPAWHEGGREPG